MTRPLPSLTEAKDLAKRLRRKLTEAGTPIGHAQSLERVAHQHGFRDWNTMRAEIRNGPPKGWAVGETVNGTYLSQPFRATVVSIKIVKPGWFHVGLDLHEAVDVVRSKRFSNLRKRIRGVVGPKGHSAEKTSNGEPQLKIDLR
ncbi:hypothetical protein TRP8649_01809 [Pelagimonas phthalicica]|uniref:Glyoxalase-related protein domain-containing protein n=1 Tax=Pelagimonas phthalicica TaxID=1037362 RepID=A0A238JAS2_9RHOB|nr:glyoxalase superfamily protein [Pelagimonas phthalicica]TDS93777.1 hypothetical protein CLV87_0263 [Pelagimonas phthalicica]SMX27699.1 hypothetical protein TRP8649_01809 [Pelagimonas phthalicica]